MTYYHLHETSKLLKDGLDNTDRDRHELIAAVASGEYFLTLATLLDGLSDDHPELQQIVHDLLYLQRTYTITAKNKS